MTALKGGVWAQALVLMVAVFGCDSAEDDTTVILTDGGDAAACSDGVDNDLDGVTDLDDPGCEDAQDNDETDPGVAECADGIDNDEDGHIDLDDRGCSSSTDRDESDEAALAECNDGIDNDDDGTTDFPEDRGCFSVDDSDESDDPPLPQCDDGIDNDEDGYTDFPQDPSCGSVFDDDEGGDEGPITPQCGDGIDNDSDGLADLTDPGCTSPADPRELEAPGAEVPACYNSLDDDGDGAIDFPYDPGCSAAGDDDEEDLERPPQCGNGLDDDDDGAIDFPFDPGCAGIGDRSEDDPVSIPQCADGRDNDRDGRIDYPEDRGCSSAADTSEGGACGRAYVPAELAPNQITRGDSRRAEFTAEGSCGGRGAPEVVFLYRVDRLLERLVITTDFEDNTLESTIHVRRGCLNPDSEIACVREPLGDDVAANTLELFQPALGDYYIFLDGAAGRGGEFVMQVQEIEIAQCRNGIDDDEDGLADFPIDPGCDQREDRDETDPARPPQCADGVDNDADGVIDFPLDFGCRAAGDNDEVDFCGQGVRVQEFPSGRTAVLGDTSFDGAENFTGSCNSGTSAPEIVYVYENLVNANLTFSVAHPETEQATLLYARSGCASAASELGCQEDTGEAPQATLVLERVPPGDVYVFVDHRIGIGGPFKLTVDVERLPPGCSDLIDNDEDGFIDADDSGCADPDDEDERDPEVPPVCFDGVDNDQDGIADYPFDPGCHGKGDGDEEDPRERPECSNGIDDDEDGATDFPADEGCQSAGDTTELQDRVRAQCGNRVDDDRDGLADYPFDPGCSAPGDTSETDDALRPQCWDEIDNDRDGLIDFPYEPGCAAAGDTDETNPEVPYACSNREDDDEDGIADFPRDPGCVSAGDQDETDPAFLPQCANGQDDDNNGRIDWPDDRGCRFAADTREISDGNPPPRCVDGVDNDDDGIIDLADPGCLNAEDDDETDLPDPPECSNGIDDDEDGALDWPADIGCQAAGDSPESQLCVDGAELIAPNGSVLGVTEEGGPDRYRNRCGGREAPDHAYRYLLEEAADLTISADNAGTDYPVILSVRRDCDEPRSHLACAGDFRRPQPTIVLRNAEPGEYFIHVDGGGPERWVGQEDGNVELSADPGHVANNDIRDACGWSDGGRDAFDCYGRFQLTYEGAASGDLRTAVGDYEGQIGNYGFVYDSALVNTNVWRMRFLPAQEGDERLVTLTVTGNLGSDGSTVAATREAQYQGRVVPFLHTADNFAAPGDPPVVHLMVPSDPEHLPNVTYANVRDNVTITATDITLPATFYVALSRSQASEQVASDCMGDIEIQAGAGGLDDPPTFGNYELSVTEAPVEAP